MPQNAGWPLDSNIIRGANRAVQLHNTFGYVRTDGQGKPRAHQGWDFWADIGTQCFAVGDGTIKLITTGKDYGLTLVHSFNWGGTMLYAAYAHLSSVEVKMGDAVTKGQPICHTGESGNAKGMARMERHLHFEVRSVVQPGLGLANRKSPLLIFGTLPLDKPIER